jgi:GH15 family glucan-1,4-alpha-glucosidase
MSRPLEDYALLGDTQSAALVANDGSLDWLCLPRFDSDACFAALLGTGEHGTWRIWPAAEPTATRRRYRGDSLVLETELEAEGGCVRLVELMPPRGETPNLVRVVEGVRGVVPMRLLFRPRFGYGRIRPWLRRLGGGEYLAVAGPELLALHARVPLRMGEAELDGEFRVSEGERIPFVLAWGPSHQAPPRPVDGLRAVEETETWWREWISQCRYRGEHPEAVHRSLSTLKALTFMPTGGIVAAPTTSLPEELGGTRNWDYRFCWLRDAAFTLQALISSGFQREARAWRDWMLRAVAGAPSQIQIMYGCAGERRIPEEPLPWLPGYADSRPVRVGNAAVEQLQIDVFGEVMECFYDAHRMGILDRPGEWRLERGIMDYLESHWQEPDQGIWEVRGGPRAFTHSRLMAWVTVDRAVRTAEDFGLDAPLDRWKALREEVRAQVLEQGFSPQRNAFTQSYGSGELDASLLLIPLVGFLPASDPRMVGTVAAIERELLQDGLVRRYRNSLQVEGLTGTEGAFLACSFWLVDNYLLQGRARDARGLFDFLLSLRNDVGLLAEQYEPRLRRQVGNFPQAFSHIGLINSARRLFDSGPMPDDLTGRQKGTVAPGEGQRETGGSARSRRG